MNPSWACCPCPAPPCDSDACAACRQTYILSVNGIVGDPSCCPPADQFCAITEWTVHKCYPVGGSEHNCEACQWSSQDSPPGTETCQEFVSAWHMGCRGSRLAGQSPTFGPSDGYWRAWNTEVTVVFVSPTKGACPPIGDWILEYNRNADDTDTCGSPTLTVAEGEAEIDPCPPELCVSDCETCEDTICLIGIDFTNPLLNGEHELTRAGCVWADAVWEIICEGSCWYAQDVATHGATVRWQHPGGCGGAVTDCPVAGSYSPVEGLQGGGVGLTHIDGVCPENCPANCDACAATICLTASFDFDDADLNGQHELTRTGCGWADAFWELICENSCWYAQDVATGGTLVKWQYPGVCGGAGVSACPDFGDFTAIIDGGGSSVETATGVCPDPCPDDCTGCPAAIVVSFTGAGYPAPCDDLVGAECGIAGCAWGDDIAGWKIFCLDGCWYVADWGTDGARALWKQSSGCTNAVCPPLEDYVWVSGSCGDPGETMSLA